MKDLTRVCLFLRFKMNIMKIALFFFLSLLPIVTFSQRNDSPKVIVGIVIDQMCYEYLYRYENKFCENGFKAFMEKGANCRTTLYNYVPTYTGPGHASIYTGAVPADHGIVGNEWYERETRKVINCVDDESVKSVGTTSNEGMCSPKNLKTYTVTDQLKMTYPSAKVISMSIKDRGAILPGGHLSDGSYWYDYATGRFVTSTFFKQELPKWVQSFNDEKQVEKYMNQTWNTLLDIEAYGESGPDNSIYEHLLPGKKTPTFPYDLKEMSLVGDKFQIFTSTPFANTYLTDFALKSLKNEQLGQDEQTDMLCISYSTPDIAGHAFGPYSVELEDMYIRLDLEIGRLLTELEKQFGVDGFTVFLTADHAVVPVPQYLVDKKLPGGYLYLNDKMTNLKDKVKSRFGADLIVEQENLNIYLDHKMIDSLQVSRAEAAYFISLEIAKWEGVKRVYTYKDLEGSSSDDSWRDMVKNGYHHRESGDVIFVLEPGYLPKSADTETSHKGTSHGSAFNYDTHVPLLWYGKGIKQQEIIRQLEITDIAATLSHLLYLQRSGAMTGSPIVELFEK
jgi:predicted AlkP superfamily pyrophosphatase or phosphodiesterase